MPCDRIDYKHLGSNDQRGFLHRTWTCVTFAVQVSRLFFPLLQDWQENAKSARIDLEQNSFTVLGATSNLMP